MCLSQDPEQGGKVYLPESSSDEQTASKHSAAVVLRVWPFWQIHVSEAWSKVVEQPRAEAYSSIQGMAQVGIAALSSASSAGSIVTDVCAAPMPARPRAARMVFSCVFIVLGRACVDKRCFVCMLGTKGRG